MNAMAPQGHRLNRPCLEVLASRLPLLAILCLTACGGGAGDHQVERSQLDGVPVVRTSGGPKYDTPILRLEEDLVIGIDEGEPAWQVFYGNLTPLVAPDGRMVLVEGQSLDIFIVSPEGELLKQLGGRGTNPGQFRNVRHLIWVDVGREFLVTDQSLDRVTAMTMDGEVVDEFDYSAMRDDFIRFHGLGNRRILAQGRQWGSVDGTIRRERFAFMDDRLRKTADFMVIDQDNYWQVGEEEYFPIPFSLNAIVSAVPDGHILVSRPSIPRISVYSTGGDLLYHIERDWAAVPITAEEKEQARELMRELIDEEAVESIPFPDHKPFFGWCLADTEGRIWVRRLEASRAKPTEEGVPGQVIAYEWEVFSADGEWLGTHRYRHRPLYITGEYYYHTRLTEAGTPQLVRMRVIPLVPEMEPARQ